MTHSSLKNLAVVPARGGSKRLPRKNVQKLNGKPLVCYTIEAALKSNCFQRIILSSDDEEIMALGEAYEGVDVERRPDRLSGDHVKVRELLWEIIDRPELAGNYDVICLLLPTCPFRQASDIRAAFELLTPEIDSVVSLTQYEFPPKLSVTIKEDGLLEPVFDPSPLITGETRSQDQTPSYRPNGGIYLSWWKSFDVNRNFFKGRVRGYVMPRLASVDIDDRIDLMYAEFLLDTGGFTLKA